MTQALHSVFVISLRRGIWRVTRDGAFHGDYRSKTHAQEGADAAAQVLRDQGYAVRVELLPLAAS